MITAEKLLGMLLMQHKIANTVLNNEVISSVTVDRGFESPNLTATFDFANGDQIVIRLKEFN